MAQYQLGANAQMVRIFFWFSPMAQRCHKNFQVPRTPRNLNLAQAITWLVSVLTIYCTILNNNPPPPRQFLLQKILKKNYLGKMLIKQNCRDR